MERTAAVENRHPVNIAHYDNAPRSARIADAVVGFMGSWTFIIVQSVVVAAWVVANVWLLTRPFDAPPFILLNLAFSTQAAYAAPLILLAGNRAAARDRLTLEHAAHEADLHTQRLAEMAATIADLKAQLDRIERQPGGGDVAGTGPELGPNPQP